MIELHVNYYFSDNTKRDAFYKQIQEEGLADASRAEAGNIRYDYYYPIGKDNVIFLLEQWKDADAVAFHNAAPHFARVGEVKAKYVEKTDIVKYLDVK